MFSANDQMALGVLRAFHEAGVSVPGDVSVVGFDDTAEAGDFWPPLTTVRQDFEGVGELCVSLLLDQIQHPGPVSTRTHRVRCSSSCGPRRPRRPPDPVAVGWCEPCSRQHRRR